MVKLAFRHTAIDALGLLMLRMFFALPFYAFTGWMARKEAVKIPPLAWGKIFFLGVMGYYLSSLFDFMGLQYVPAGIERLILFLYPSFSLIINALYYKAKPAREQWIALSLTYLGLLIAFMGEIHFHVDSLFYYGAFLILLCSFTYSVYLTGSAKLIGQIGAPTYNSFAMLAATGGIFLHFLLSGNIGRITHYDISTYSYSAAIAVFSTVIPSFLLSYSLKVCGSNTVSLLSSIGPVSTIVQAYYFLGEPIHGMQVAGTVLVILGILLLGLKPVLQNYKFFDDVFYRTKQVII